MLSHCKINLGLKITGRRLSDGYHLIESLFIPVNIGDEIRIQSTGNKNGLVLRSENRLQPQSRAWQDFESVSERGDVTKNLIFKTFERLKHTLPETGGLEVELIKKTPPGSGIGQGSSNAAMLLRFFIEEKRITMAEARETGLSLGADIPFFLSDRPALVSGIGEIIEPVDLPVIHGILCFPGISVNTGAAYSELKKPLHHGASQQKGFLLSESDRMHLSEENYSRLGLYNEFEPVVTGMYPELQTIKNSFRECCGYSSMSGSGSAFYGLLPEDQVESAISHLRSRHPGLQFEAFRSLSQ